MRADAHRRDQKQQEEWRCEQRRWGELVDEVNRSLAEIRTRRAEVSRAKIRAIMAQQTREARESIVSRRDGSVSVSSRTDVENFASGKVPDKEEVSVFESQPKGRTAAVTWCTQAPSDGVEVSTFESQPALSRADTSCSAEERRAEEAQCVFESNPTARVVDVSSTTVEEGTSENRPFSKALSRRDSQQ